MQPPPFAKNNNQESLNITYDSELHLQTNEKIYSWEGDSGQLEQECEDTVSEFYTYTLVKLRQKGIYLLNFESLNR